MDYLKLIKHSYQMDSELHDHPQSKLEYLAEHIFDFTTYENEFCQAMARRAIEVALVISHDKTYDYIANEHNHQWYLMMVNMPFFVNRIEWSSSIRGAYWLNRFNTDKLIIKSCGLWMGNKQLTNLSLRYVEWVSFIDALYKFGLKDE